MKEKGVRMFLQYFSNLKYTMLTDVLKYISILILFSACRLSNEEKANKLSSFNVDSMLIQRYGNEISTEKKVLLKDKQIIEHIYENYLVNSSEAYGKLPIEYGIISYKKHVQDSFFLNQVFFKSSNLGTRKMKNNIGPLLDKLLCK